MGTPIPGLEASEDTFAETLLDALKGIAASERREHATVFNYWHSIRQDRDFPLIRDLDPLEISDAGPKSVLLGIIDGGQDAEIRHLGASIKAGIEAEKLSEAKGSSLLTCIAGKLPDVVASKQAFAFEGRFESPDGEMRCSVSLFPFSTDGSAVDYIYGLVSLGPADATAEELDSGIVEFAVGAEDSEDEEEETELLLDDAISEIGSEEADTPEASVAEPEPAQDDGGPGFSEAVADTLKSPSGFWGQIPGLKLGKWKVEGIDSEEDSQPAREPDAIDQETAEVVADESVAEPEIEPEETVETADVADEPEAELEDELKEPAQPFVEEPVADEPEMQPEVTHDAPQAPLASALDAVRGKADEARQAKLEANLALYRGLSAAYDFALDAEDEPEQYLRLVEAQGLKIQLRSPMAPVVRLAFDGLCDDSTIAQLEAVLAWAIGQNLPRGGLFERIQSEGGIAGILAGKS